jgi:hypothetical protein
MPCTIQTQTRNGLEVLRLANECVSADVLPQLGAKIYTFIHVPSGTSLLWHNPRLAPAPVHFGARFDDNWSGGWDELVPNDIPFPFPNGDVVPDHGEVWSQAASPEVLDDSGDRVAVRFVHLGRVLATRFEKQIELRRGEPLLRIRYRYENQGPKAIHFLWNVHPAMRISPATWLDVPARRGLVEEWGNEQFEPGLEYQWPFAPDRTGKRIDLRRVPSPSEGVADHHYLPDVSAGWYAVTNTEKRVGFGLVFPTAVFPHLWLFRAIGGWRGLNTLILEASNGLSSNLAKCIERSQCGVLAPGAAVEAEVIAIAYQGCLGVERIEPDGHVVAAKG